MEIKEPVPYKEAYLQGTKVRVADRDFSTITSSNPISLKMLIEWLPSRVLGSITAAIRYISSKPFRGYGMSSVCVLRKIMIPFQDQGSKLFQVQSNRIQVK